ncbi:hypothetical protein KUF71_025774 [Frankliniella fusca]|uniref:Uncharacterized protein n=1 Tax=Frankliniella fusca TaxID=407009 RepID=A0AAE1I398_9NEOP|nr:hypothetical protein KUF71_025774 [Frankliniella fusca]
MTVARTMGRGASTAPA